MKRSRIVSKCTTNNKKSYLHSLKNFVRRLAIPKILIYSNFGLIKCTWNVPKSLTLPSLNKLIMKRKNDIAQLLRYRQIQAQCTFWIKRTIWSHWIVFKWASVFTFSVSTLRLIQRGLFVKGLANWLRSFCKGRKKILEVVEF